MFNSMTFYHVIPKSIRSYLKKQMYQAMFKSQFRNVKVLETGVLS